ncbi:MAG: helix-turn-helix transcriptional regulator [Clostridia bacterium]|nr:helix-turn-helix transcriptional regulator [Clostridia bacterium]
MKFNEKLVKLRKENLLSQEELAEKLGVTRQTISKWELEQTTPDMDKLSQISKLFNVSVDELLNEADEPIKANQTSDKNNNKKNTAIVIILIIILIVVLGGVGISIFYKPANSVENGKENVGIIESIVDSFMNTFDKIMKKGEEIKNKNDQEFKEEQRKMREEMQNWYDEQTNKMNEEYEKKKNEVYDSYNKSVQETNERYQQQYEQQKNQVLNNMGF